MQSQGRPERRRVLPVYTLALLAGIATAWLTMSSGESPDDRPGVVPGEVPQTGETRERHVPVVPPVDPNGQVMES